MTSAEKKAQKVLIADPEPFIRDTLKIKLMSKGFQVVLADCGKEMVARASREKPDLIITEIKFKDLDTYRACQILKGNDKTKDIPIVILTHESETLEKKFMFSPYVAKFITKPFGTRELAKAVQEVIASSDVANP